MWIKQHNKYTINKSLFNKTDTVITYLVTTSILLLFGPELTTGLCVLGHGSESDGSLNFDGSHGSWSGLVIVDPRATNDCRPKRVSFCRRPIRRRVTDAKVVTLETLVYRRIIGHVGRVSIVQRVTWLMDHFRWLCQVRSVRPILLISLTE